MILRSRATRIFWNDVDNQELGLKSVMLILGGLLLPPHITHIICYSIVIVCISHLPVPLNQQLFSIGSVFDHMVDDHHLKNNTTFIIRWFWNPAISPHYTPRSLTKRVFPLKNDTWKTILSFWASVTFKGRFL